MFKIIAIVILGIMGLVFAIKSIGFLVILITKGVKYLKSANEKLSLKTMWLSYIEQLLESWALIYAFFYLLNH